MVQYFQQNLGYLCEFPLHLQFESEQVSYFESSFFSHSFFSNRLVILMTYSIGSLSCSLLALTAFLSRWSILSFGMNFVTFRQLTQS